MQCCMGCLARVHKMSIVYMGLPIGDTMSVSHRSNPEGPKG